MDNFEDNVNSTEKPNRFIFSDSYYDDMPLDSSKSSMDNLSSNKEVLNSNASLPPKVSIPLPNQNLVDIHQASSLDQVVNNDYSEEDNLFNFFGKNIENEDITAMGQPTMVISDYQTTNHTDNSKKGFLSSIEERIGKKKEDQLDIVYVEEKPIPEIVSYQPTINMQDDKSLVSESVIPEIVVDLPSIDDELRKVKEEIVPEVDTRDVEDHLIDNIVDYQTFNNTINNPDFMDIGLSKDKPRELVPSIMNADSKATLDINSGINKQLEEELIAQKRLEDEERKKNDLHYNEYLKYKSKEPEQKFLYRAREQNFSNNKSNNYTFVKNEQPKKVSTTNVSEDKPDIVYIKDDALTEPRSIQDTIDSILGVSGLEKVLVPINPLENPGVQFGFMEPKEEKTSNEDEITTIYDEKEDNFNYDQNFDNVIVNKSDLLDKLKEKANNEGIISILARYGEDFCAKDYVTNPAIGRAEEIKQLILILLTPEKSGILIGKPGIGKTSIVEGLAYQLQRNNVPDALKGYVIVSVKTASLLGTLPTGETRLQTLVDELKQFDKVILFIDEIHMLIGSTNESALDFANMFKESLGRGSIKVIGATTTEEYERYVLRDKAFVRRFQKVEVMEPSREHTIKILLGTLPKIEKSTGAKLKYTQFVQTRIMSFIVDITTEYKRIYGIGSRYPDICLTLLAQAFSQAVFANKKEVTIFDIRKAIENSKNIYPDVIRKELVNFDKMFKDVIKDEELAE